MIYEAIFNKRLHINIKEVSYFLAGDLDSESVIAP